MAAAVIDLWQYVDTLFTAKAGEQPEVYISGLSPDAMSQVIRHIIDNSRDVETAFFDFYEVRQEIRSAHHMVNGLQNGDLMGEIWCDLRIEGYSLPNMGFYSDEPGFIVIDYVMGEHWNPLRVIALFEFFRLIKLWDSRANIRISPRYFGQDAAEQFDRVLEAYLRESI